MALMTNYPIALAPGMGLNAFFAFTMCGAFKVPWPGGARPGVLGGRRFPGADPHRGPPEDRRRDPAKPEARPSAAASGLFIAFIGLKNGGIIVANPATFVGLGDLSQPGPLLVLFGIILTAVLIVRKVRGAIIVSVLALTVIGLFLPAPAAADGTRPMITQLPSAAGERAGVARADVFQARFRRTCSRISRRRCRLLLTLLFVDLFDNVGTLHRRVQTRRAARRAGQPPAHRPRAHGRRGRGDVRRVPGHFHDDELHRVGRRGGGGRAHGADRHRGRRLLSAGDVSSGRSSAPSRNWRPRRRWSSSACT